MQVQFEVAFDKPGTTREGAIAQAKRELLYVIENGEWEATVADVDEAPDATITYWLVTATWEV